ncbi:ATP-binding cassette domain-containing protein [Chryseobacterium wanjuense]
MHLQIKQANIGYNKTLISNANTNLNLGEVCLLIGNNGVGKTTLIKSILHQIPVLSGEIFINDKNVKNLSVKEIAENIAVVFFKVGHSSELYGGRPDLFGKIYLLSFLF